MSNPNLRDERKMKALAEDESRYRTMVNTAADAIVAVDAAGSIVALNPAAENMFGYAAGELAGRDVAELLPPQSADVKNKPARWMLDRENSVRAWAIFARRRNGEVFPVDISVGESNTPGNEMLIYIIRDATERKRVEHDARERLRELAHASRVAAMGEMTSGITHEVNQPLTAIVSFAKACLRMLETGTANPEVLSKTLQKIAHQGERASHIVGRLRELSRKGVNSPASLNINDLVKDVLDLSRHDISSRNIQLNLDLSPGLAEILADKVEIEQVVLNLVRNAIDAMDEAGTADAVLAVQTKSSAAGVEVTVSDTGAGIAESAMPHLYETFFTTKTKGVGLGLSISRNIAEAHGGRLWLTRNPIRGTSFHFSLPFEERSKGEA